MSELQLLDKKGSLDGSLFLEEEISEDAKLVVLINDD